MGGAGGGGGGEGAGGWKRGGQPEKAAAGGDGSRTHRRDDFAHEAGRGTGLRRGAGENAVLLQTGVQAGGFDRALPARGGRFTNSGAVVFGAAIYGHLAGSAGSGGGHPGPAQCAHPRGFRGDAAGRWTEGGG